MAVKPYQTGFNPVGHFDFLDSDLPDIKGGEIVVFDEIEIASSSDTSSADVFKAGSKRTLLRLATGADAGPFFIAEIPDEGLFHQPGFEVTSLYSQNQPFAKETTASGKIGIFAQEGFYALNSDVVDSTTVNSSTLVGSRLYADSDGHATATPSASGAIIGFFVEFQSGALLRGFPDRFRYAATHKTGDSIVIYKTNADGYLNLDLIAEAIGERGELGVPTDGEYSDGYYSFTENTKVNDAIDEINTGMKLVMSGISKYSGAGDLVTLYVDVNGNDETGDGSIGNPYARPERALQDIPDDVERHFIIYCNAGVYSAVTISRFFNYPVGNTGSVRIRGDYGDLNEVVTVLAESANADEAILGDITVEPFGFSIVANNTFAEKSYSDLAGYEYFIDYRAVVDGYNDTITFLRPTFGSFTSSGEVRVFTLGTTFTKLNVYSNITIERIRLTGTFPEFNGHGTDANARSSPLLSAIVHDEGQLSAANAYFTVWHVNVGDPGGSAFQHLLHNVNLREMQYNAACNTQWYANGEFKMAMYDIRHTASMSSASRPKFTMTGGNTSTTTNTRFSFDGQGICLFLLDGATFIARSNFSLGPTCSTFLKVDYNSVYYQEHGSVTGTCTSHAIQVNNGGSARVSPYTGLASTPTGADVLVGSLTNKFAISDLPITDLDTLSRVF